MKNLYQMIFNRVIGFVILDRLAGCRDITSKRRCSESITCLFFILFSCHSYSDEVLKNIGHHLGRTGQPEFAENSLINNSSNILLKHEYFNLLISGSLGERKLVEAKKFYEDNFKNHHLFADELKAVLLFLNGDRKSAVELLKSKDYIANPYAGTFLAKEYYKGKYLSQDFEKAYAVVHPYKGRIYEAELLRSKFNLEKTYQFAAADSAFGHLVSSFHISINHKNTDIPALLLMHLSQDGILMPKDNILSAAIALATPKKTDRLITIFHKTVEKMTIKEYYKAYELSLKILNEVSNSNYKFSELFLQPYIGDRVYRITEGLRKGATKDFPAYNVDKILESYK